MKVLGLLLILSSYNRWLTVFSSVIVKKENLGMSEDAIGEG